jgi:hypothetical protein
MQRGSLRHSSKGFQELGWADGRNVRIETRWTGGDADHFRKYAAELVGACAEQVRDIVTRNPDVIVTGTRYVDQAMVPARIDRFSGCCARTASLPRMVAVAKASADQTQRRNRPSGARAAENSEHA